MSMARAMEIRCFSPRRENRRPSQYRVIAIRQGHDEIVAAGGLGRGHHLLMGGVRAAKLMLFSTVSLKDTPTGTPWRCSSSGCPACTPAHHGRHGDPSAPGTSHEAGDKITEVKSCRRRRTYHGGGAAGGDCKAHMIQNGPFPHRKKRHPQTDRGILRAELRPVNVHHRRIVDGIGLYP